MIPILTDLWGHWKGQGLALIIISSGNNFNDQINVGYYSNIQYFSWNSRPPYLCIQWQNFLCFAPKLGYEGRFSFLSVFSQKNKFMPLKIRNVGLKILQHEHNFVTKLKNLKTKIKHFKGYGLFWNMWQMLITKMQHLKW